jgi:predicted transcriptional regulator
MNDSATSTNTAELTAEIVSAYVSNNRIAPSELGSPIRAVANQLTAVGAEPEQPAEEAPGRRFRFAARFSRTS